MFQPILLTRLTMMTAIFSLAGFAGTIHITGADPFSYASAGFKDRSGADESKQLQTDANGNVDITFSAAVQKDSYDGTVTKIKNGKRVTVDISLPLASVDNFYDREPVRFASFFDVFIELAPIQIDMQQWIIENHEDLYVPGNLYNVLNGHVEGTNAIVIGTFTGQVIADQPLRFVHPVPEPTTFLTLGFGLCAIGLIRRGRRT